MNHGKVRLKQDINHPDEKSVWIEAGSIGLLTADLLEVFAVMFEGYTPENPCWFTYHNQKVEDHYDRIEEGGFI